MFNYDNVAVWIRLQHLAKGAHYLTITLQRYSDSCTKM